MASKVRKGDTVEVVGGAERGKRGKVLRFFPASADRPARVVVEGIRMIKRHMRPTPKNPQGGIAEREAPLAASQVQVVDPKANKPTRVGFRVGDDGRKVRVARRSGEVLA
jgi:large subunit ribosomal protein L24